MYRGCCPSPSRALRGPLPLPASGARDSIDAAFSLWRSAFLTDAVRDRRVVYEHMKDFIQRLLEEALPPEDGDDDLLYQAALAVEKEEVLAAEMAEWETATIEDGLTGGNPSQNDDS